MTAKISKEKQEKKGREKKKGRAQYVVFPRGHPPQY
jgi:hypothetical protein